MNPPSTHHDHRRPLAAAHAPPSPPACVNEPFEPTTPEVPGPPGLEGAPEEPGVAPSTPGGRASGLLTRRSVMMALAALPAGVAWGAGSAAAAAPLALVYRGPASSPGTAEAAMRAVQYRGAFRTRYVGPQQAIRLTSAALRATTLYIQPGGGTVAGSWPYLRPYRSLLVNWVRGGGHYLGLCLGGYLAADDPGLALFPGRIGDYKRTHGADITTDAEGLATIVWRGRRRRMYVQDPPVFTVDPRARRVAVLARYLSGHVAAVSVPVGRGRVTLVGPHPEAPPSWYRGGPRRWHPGPWLDTERAAVAP